MKIKITEGGEPMGLIHSRAAKQRLQAEAAAIREQTIAERNERYAADNDGILPVWTQPTTREAIQAALHNRRTRRSRQQP
jgi:hypothetical protein